MFLLNTVLTVRAASANSHAKQGWENFTDATIKFISEHTRNVVFLLWGKSAQSKASMISSSKHLVLKSVHPSPLSGKKGCGVTVLFYPHHGPISAQHIEASLAAGTSAR